MTKYYIIYDDECALCNRLLLFIARADTANIFKFLPANSSLAKKLIGTKTLENLSDKTVILYTVTKKYTRSLAVQKILLLLPRYRWLGILMRCLPVRFTDIFYRFIARYRKYFRANFCPVVPKELRDKFLER